MAKATTINKAYVEKFIGENGNYPEVGTFSDKKDLQKFYKHVPTEQLEDWVAVEGLEIAKVDSEAIYRMRLCMAVLYLHFPKAPSTKKKSKYADFSLEDLMQMSVDKGVIFEMTDDERILRMRAIMALRVAGHIE